MNKYSSNSKKIFSIQTLWGTVRVIRWGREVKRCLLTSRRWQTTYRPVAATVVFPDGHPHRHLLTRLPVFFACSRDHKPNHWEVSVTKKKKLNVRQDARGSVTIALKERRRRLAGRKEAKGETLNKLKVRKSETC